MRRLTLALVSVALIGCWPDSSGPDSERRYVNARFQFSVQLPRDGERRFSDNGDGVVVRWGGRSQMSFSGGHNALGWDDASAMATDFHPTLPQRPVRVAGRSAIEVANGDGVRWIYLIDGGANYTLALEGGDALAFRRACDSFRILNSRAIRGG